MSRPRIGTNIHDLRLPPKQAIEHAARLGFDTIELRTLDDELDPRNLSTSGRRHLSRLVRDLGMSMAALDADLGAKGLLDPASVDVAVQRTGQVLELACEMRVPVVVGTIGRLGDADTRRRDEALAALRAIGEMADRTGSIYAVSTSLTSPRILKALLDELACPSIRICTDPGLWMMAGYDPLAATESLAAEVAMSHARDALPGTPDHAGREMPLGQGQVNWIEYLAALSAAGYRGPHILRRTDSQRPAEELSAARALLETMTT